MKKNLTIDLDAVALEAAHLETKAKLLCAMGENITKQADLLFRSSERLWKVTGIPKAQRAKIKTALRIAAYRQIAAESAAAKKKRKP